MGIALVQLASSPNQEPSSFVSASGRKISELADIDMDTTERGQISPKAVRGKNDFLFLGGEDSNGLIQHITGAKAITEDPRRLWAD
jgi:hypothetical protein